MTTDLTEDLADLARAVDTLNRRGEGACETHARAVHDLLDRVETRRALAPGTLVVALAGTTGAGKSSLFNAITGAEYADVGVRRPTTIHATAAIFGPPEPGVGGLLDWLGISDRYTVTNPAAELESVILIDLPDIDSIASDNRVTAERYISTADVLLWVVDPEKYADAHLHEGYLRPLAGHGAVMDVVLNQVDRLSATDRDRAVADLRQRLRDAGIDSQVFGTSVRTGVGVDALTARLRDRAEKKRDQEARLHYDAAALGRHLAGSHPPVDTEQGYRSITGFGDDVAASVGVPQFAHAAAAAHRHELLRATGWPPLRPIRKARKTPPAPQLHTAFLAEPTAHLSAAFVGTGTWPGVLRRAVAESGEAMRKRLRLYRPAPVAARGLPRWAGVMRAIQWFPIGLLLIAAVAFGAEVGLRYFGLTLPPALQSVPAAPGYPALPAVPWAVAIAVIALVAMLLTAGLTGILRRVSTRRYRRAVAGQVHREVREVVVETVSHPLTDLLEDARAYGRALTKITQNAVPGPHENVRRRRPAP